MSRKKSVLSETENRGGTVWFPGDYSELRDLSQELKKKTIEAEAKKDAEANIPAVDSKEPQGMEAVIFQKTINGCGQLSNQFSGMVDNCLNFIKTSNHVEFEFEDSNSDREGDEIVEDLEEELGGLLSNNQKDLHDTQADLYDTRQRLLNFKEDNHLDREAKYPDSIWLVAGIIAMLILAETILNGVMFRDVADGLLGGIFLAVLLSLVNVGLGLIMGFFGIRYALKRGEKTGGQKAFGISIIVVIASLGAFLNLLVAHYRETAVNFDGLSAVKPMESMMNAPFAFEDPKAIILLLFGFLVLFVAAYEGFSRISDRYPGYKEVDLAYNEAKLNFEDVLYGLRDQVAERFEAYRAEIQSKIDTEKSKADDAEQSFKKLATEKRNILVSLEQEVQSGNRLLDIYRSTNTRRRMNVVIPRFKDGIDLKHASPDTLVSMEPVEKLVKTIRSAAKKNAPFYKTQLRRTFSYGKEFDEHFNSYLDEAKKTAGERLQLGTGDRMLDLDIISGSVSNSAEA